MINAEMPQDNPHLLTIHSQYSETYDVLIQIGNMGDQQINDGILGIHNTSDNVACLFRTTLVMMAACEHKDSSLVAEYIGT